MRLYPYSSTVFQYVNKLWLMWSESKSTLTFPRFLPRIISKTGCACALADRMYLFRCITSTFRRSHFDLEVFMFVYFLDTLIVCWMCIETKTPTLIPKLTELPSIYKIRKYS
jgi:hypothetical protein